eukprot:scaffold1789_cov193-Isochrysis_galbana.AAC.1
MRRLVSTCILGHICSSFTVSQQYASICSIYARYMRCTVCRVMLSGQQLCSPAFGGLVRCRVSCVRVRYGSLRGGRRSRD